MEKYWDSENPQSNQTFYYNYSTLIENPDGAPDFWKRLLSKMGLKFIGHPGVSNKKPLASSLANNPFFTKSATIW